MFWLPGEAIRTWTPRPSNRVACREPPMKGVQNHRIPTARVDQEKLRTKTTPYSCLGATGDRAGSRAPIKGICLLHSQPSRLIVRKS